MPDRSPNPGALTISTDATGELLMPLLAADTGPTRERVHAAKADRVARPGDLAECDIHLNVMRAFRFADLRGFTACAAASPGEVLAVGGVHRLRVDTSAS